MVSSAETDEPYFAKYLQFVPRDFVPLTSLAMQQATLGSILSSVSDAESLRLHPPYTWTLRQVVNHLSDCERVFAFRLLWMARGQTEPMTSFDENRFSLLAQANETEWHQLVKDLDIVRQSSLSLIESLPNDAWKRTGTSAGFAMDVSLQCRIIYGHAEHHIRIIKERLKLA
jgi:hypothetical protein